VSQLSLFAGGEADLPQGFRYQSDFVSAEEEAALAARFAGLDFSPFAFRGFEGRRRVVHYGWRYDYGSARIQRSEPIPDWLAPLREQAAAWARMEPATLEQALVTEYAPGAPIGWHRDRPNYRNVIGVSFLSACSLRLRRRERDAWIRRTVVLEPRSIYLFSGQVRTDWEHSIPPAEALRYSVTFRSMVRRPGPEPGPPDGGGPRPGHP
jgi:alkylated DNA repair dioxygenase AlkB